MQIESEAWGAFKENMKDVDRLMSIHAEIAGDAPGRKYGVEVLNKASVILLTACWEAFVEDMCQRAAEFLISSTSKGTDYPLTVRMRLARCIRDDKDERRVWSMAGEGWKEELRQYAIRTIASFNTPRATNVDNLFGAVLGLKQLSRAWRWRGTSCTNARSKLDELITLRGSLAHRAKAGQSVTKSIVLSHKAHVSRLVENSTLATAGFLSEVLGFNATRTVLL